MTIEQSLLFLITSFAVYRISRMIALEDGAFNLFALLRGWVFTKFGNGWINEGVNCPMCISWWIALPIAFVVSPLNLLIVFLVWQALSGIAVFLYKMERQDA